MVYAILLGSLVLQAAALNKAGPPDQERWMQQLPQMMDMRQLSELQLQHQSQWPFESNPSLDGVGVKVMEMHIDPSFGSGNFTMNSGECSEKFEYGHRHCVQHWGKEWIGRIHLEQKRPFLDGATFSIKSWGKGLGILSMLTIPENTHECNMCGNTCSWPVTAIAGAPVLPTIEDISKLPVVGMAAAAVARRMKVPETRDALSRMISEPLEKFARNTGYWSQEDLKNRIVTVAGEKVDIKMMKCPFTMGTSPTHTNARFPGASLFAQGGDFGWKVAPMSNFIGSMQMQAFTEVKMHDHHGKEVFRIKMQQCINCDPH